MARKPQVFGIVWSVEILATRAGADPPNFKAESNVPISASPSFEKPAASSTSIVMVERHTTRNEHGGIEGGLSMSINGKSDQPACSCQFRKMPLFVEKAAPPNHHLLPEVSTTP